MKILRATTELKRLQDQLKDAAELQDLPLMEDLTNKIRKIQDPKIFTSLGYDDIVDERNGKIWRGAGEFDWNYINVWRNQTYVNGYEYRFPTIDDLLELTEGIKDPKTDNLKKLGFFTLMGNARIFLDESFHKPSKMSKFFYFSLDSVDILEATENIHCYLLFIKK